jgi:mono/diheme cytochrome c family protein
MKMFIAYTLVFMYVLTACGGFDMVQDQDVRTDAPAMVSASEMMGRGMGPGSGMMDRHHARVPDEFAGVTNPILADEESLARGQKIYTEQCATCHGDYGNGDGPGGANLNPAPAPIAHTGQMMGDAYLYWRITEGGIPFESGMIPYRDILDEKARWDVINYVRALGRGRVQPGEHMGGQPFDPTAEDAQRAEMLAQAIEQEVITPAEADVFALVHSAMDEYLVVEGISGVDTGQRADALPQILIAMVAGEKVTQSQADTFIDIHDRLIDAGLMQ